MRGCIQRCHTSHSGLPAAAFRQGSRDSWLLVGVYRVHRRRWQRSRSRRNCREHAFDHGVVAVHAVADDVAGIAANQFVVESEASIDTAILAIGYEIAIHPFCGDVSPVELAEGVGLCVFGQAVSNSAAMMRRSEFRSDVSIMLKNLGAWFVSRKLFPLFFIRNMLTQVYKVDGRTS